MKRYHLFFFELAVQLIWLFLKKIYLFTYNNALITLSRHLTRRQLVNFRRKKMKTRLGSRSYKISTRKWSHNDEEIELVKAKCLGLALKQIFANSMKNLSCPETVYVLVFIFFDTAHTDPLFQISSNNLKIQSSLFWPKNPCTYN